MKSDIPNIPIPTVAGISSLADMMPDMPLPSSVPPPTGTRALLFHPRVAEEAQNLLNLRDDHLVTLLANSLLQTSSIHIDLKDRYTNGEPGCDQQQRNQPELLKAILQKNPNVFKGTVPPQPKLSHHAQALLQQHQLQQQQKMQQKLQQQQQQQHQEQLNMVPNQDWQMHQQQAFIQNSYDQLNYLPQQQELLQQQQQQQQIYQQPMQNSYQQPYQQPQFQPQMLNHQQQPRQQQQHYGVITNGPSQSYASPVQNYGGENYMGNAQFQNNFVSGQNEVQFYGYNNFSQIQNSIHNSGIPTPSPSPHRDNNYARPSVISSDVQRGSLPYMKKYHDNAMNHQIAPPMSSPILSAQEVLEQFTQHQMGQFSDASQPSFISDTTGYSGSIEETINDMTRNACMNETILTPLSMSSQAGGNTTPSNRMDNNTFLNIGMDEAKKVEPAMDFIDTSYMSNMRASRKRTNRLDLNQGEDSEEEIIVKPKLKRVERKLIPKISKLNPEELMETNTYQKFYESLDKIFEDTEDLDLSLDMNMDEDEDIPEEMVIQKYQMAELAGEAAKLKSMGCLESIPTDKLIRLLGILEKNIRSGIKISPIADPNDSQHQRKIWVDLAMERVTRALDASLACMYIFTSQGMHKKIYLEDVIDRVVQFTAYQLKNTIYPSYDAVYRTKRNKDLGSGGGSRSGKKNKLNNMVGAALSRKEGKEKGMMGLYTKLVELVSLLAELLTIQPLSDNSVLHLSNIGIGPFFVDHINEMQLNAMKLVTNIFERYEKHRKYILDDILASMARLSNAKQLQRNYRLSNHDSIQMITALVLQLVQCVTVMPKNSKPRDADADIAKRFKAAQMSASHFLLVFLSKCSSKSEKSDETDYRSMFEHFVQDLLTTVNKPEWPASELYLSLLGGLLVKNFGNKQLDVSYRVACLDYLGLVAARLRKDSTSSNLKQAVIDNIIKEIREAEERDDDVVDYADGKELTDDDGRQQYLQKVLMDYLAVKSASEDTMSYARHFYLCQWYQDTVLAEANDKHPHPHRQDDNNNQNGEGGGDGGGEKASVSEESAVAGKKNGKKKKKKKKKILDSDDDTDEENEEERGKGGGSVYEERKKYLFHEINPFGDVDESVAKKRAFQMRRTYIDYDSATLITKYLSSKRTFAKSFDAYLKHIIKVSVESSVQIRTKAMKCLAMIIEADPNVLAMSDMRVGVCHSFLDHSTSVREAAVDLVGKFVLNKPSLLDQYYDILSERILDTGVSVRKRVIKILRDICVECPSYSKIPEICVKIIKRINDEDGVKKLVMEVFQNMWFTLQACKSAEQNEELKMKVAHITDVALLCREQGLEWFEQLLNCLFKPKEDKDDATKVASEPPKALVDACMQIVNCLVDMVITLDGRGGNAPKRLVGCVTTLYMFAKIRPQLLVQHAITLQPYLGLKCQNRGDYQIISCVARTLEIVVPMLEHASETFLSQLEEDSVKLIFQHDQTVISSCISCLGSVINNVTHNFGLIRDCFMRYFRPLKKLKCYMKTHTDPMIINNDKIRAEFRRSMFIVGLILRFFDFKNKKLTENALPSNICEEVFNTLSYFMHVEDAESRLFALKSLGNVCIRHYDFMMEPGLMAHYHYLLKEETVAVQMKVQVLNNIQIYLLEEEKRMMKQDEDWQKRAKKENLKEMQDVSSGMASAIIQQYLTHILESILHISSAVRQAALKVIQLILSQGLVHPVQIVPYLICMSTDENRSINACAEKRLQDIERKYPGFIHMKAQLGIKLSFQLQKIIQGADYVRGFRGKEGDVPYALNGFLYTILRGKQHRRAIITSILKQFEEQSKTSLAQMLYLADNLAYFPFQVLDEPLFIIHHINVSISVHGTNLLQSFREALLPNPTAPVLAPGEVMSFFDEDEDETIESLLSRLPPDTTVLRECITASQGFIMLLILKQHLKTLYGFTDSKIALYSPSDSSKVYEKAVTRKTSNVFNPKAALYKLQRGDAFTYDSEEGKKELVGEYLEFKHLIISLDREEEEGEEEEGGNKEEGNGGGGVGQSRISRKKSGGGDDEEVGGGGESSTSATSSPQQQMKSSYPPDAAVAAAAAGKMRSKRKSGKYSGY